MAVPTTQDPSAPLMLSVSGARGIVGASMTPAVAADLAAAYASFVKAVTGRGSPVFVVGRDPRPSGAMLAAAATAGLTAAGCRVIDLGMVTTPTVGIMIDDCDADAGLMVTASHNPIAWNGLKFLNADGVAPPASDAEAIIGRFSDRRIDYAPVESLAAVRSDGTAHDRHVNRVLRAIDPEPIRAARFRVVMDPVNGAGCIPGRMLLERLGCEVDTLNGEPSGLFGRGAEPLAEHLGELAARTRAFGAACGFALDPDADRLAVIDETGRYVGEECTLVLAAKQVLDLQGGGPVVANLSTSRMIDDLVARYDGGRVLRSAVGEANVVEVMRSAGAAIGGEGNGGVVFPAVGWVRDGLSSMALVLALLAAQRRALSRIVDELSRYTMIKRKFDLTDLGGREAVPDLLARVAAHFRFARIDTTDGLRVDRDDGWVHLRSSNTEPIVRLIAEAASGAAAQRLIEEARTAGGM